MRGVRLVVIHLATALAIVAAIPLAVLAGLLFYVYVGVRSVVFLFGLSTGKPRPRSTHAIGREVRRSA